ncbi:MAG: hypothetical protein JWL83_2105 [Actinomycetia bacterium]|nr:hypothetical protein [Actinomycetes bacterium]
MDLVARFASLVSRPGAELPLDEVALVMSAHARAPFDIAEGLARLDDLALGCGETTFDALAGHLFGAVGFRGNTARYDDPDNSFLDQVLERRVGIPITLAVVMIEVGRRLGVGVLGIGMPGHFLVRAADADVYCDPFNGGTLLDSDGCAALFHRVAGGAQPFDAAFLAPATALQILKRMFANLEHGPFANDPVRLGALLDLHLMIPSLGSAERLSLGAQLANVGRFADAARVLEAGASQSMESKALLRQARTYRARLN